MSYVKILSESLNVKLGDTATEFHFQLLDDYKGPTDLTGKTVTVQLATKDTLVLQRDADIIDAETGEISFSIEPTDEIGHGRRDVEFVVNGTEESGVYPSRGYITLNVNANLLDRDGSEEYRVSLLDLQQDIQQYTQKIDNAEQTAEASAQQVDNYIANHATEEVPHKYGNRFSWQYNPTNDSMELVVHDV